MKRRSLRHLTRQRVGRKDLQGVAAELRAMQDRAAAIVAATLVEDALEDIILSRMRKLTKDEYGSLFLGDGPLATFSSKTRVATALKLIYRSWAEQIDIVREIRNVFAHARSRVDFDTPEIVEQLKRITVVEEHLDPNMAFLWKGSNIPINQIAKSVRLHDPRDRYIGSCLFIAIWLWDVRPDPDDWWDEDEDET